MSSNAIDQNQGRTIESSEWPSAVAPGHRSLVTFGNIMTLPPDMLATANCESKEEAWRVPDFPAVLERASFHRLACVGGQFQFRGPIGIAEMYWLNADSTPRREGESWDGYVDRANAEVLSTFTRLVEQTDFLAEARQWKHIIDAIDKGTISDPKEHVYFVAYFDPNPEIAEPAAAANLRKAPVAEPQRSASEFKKSDRS